MTLCERESRMNEQAATVTLPVVPLYKFPPFTIRADSCDSCPAFNLASSTVSRSHHPVNVRVANPAETPGLLPVLASAFP